MFTPSKTLVCCIFVVFLTAAGCANEDNPSNSEASTLECGPNATLHEVPGGDAHCDCNAGYKYTNGICVADQPDEPEPDVTSAPEDDAAELPRALPISCWLAPGSLCDPRKGEVCNLAAGETCDLATMPEGNLNIMCLPGPNTQGLNESCNPSSGPYCAVGLHCVDPGVCKKFCCDNTDCGTKVSCKPITAAAGTLGVCNDGVSAPKPACAPPGGFCQTASDCCSSNCHAGHCH